MKRSPKKLSPERVRELHRIAQQIDRDEADAIKQLDREVKAHHDERRKQTEPPTPDAKQCA